MNTVTIPPITMFRLTIVNKNPEAWGINPPIIPTTNRLTQINTVSFSVFIISNAMCFSPIKKLVLRANKINSFSSAFSYVSLFSSSAYFYVTYRIYMVKTYYNSLDYRHTFHSTYRTGFQKSKDAYIFHK